MTRRCLWPIAKANWVPCLLFSVSLGATGPAAADGARCDQLAALAADPLSQSDPVDYAAIDGQAVVDACHQALIDQPNNGRFWVQLGRGYLKLDRGADMVAAFEQAKALEYPVAWFALAVTYHTGNGRSGSDRAQAEVLYREAYERGVGYAALGLARLYDEPGQAEFDPEKSQQWQRRFDERSR